MQSARPTKLFHLTYLLPLLLMACSDSPTDSPEAVAAVLSSDDGVLRYVPMDTPYVVAVAKPAPDEVREKLAPHVRAIARSYAKLLQAAIRHNADDGSTPAMDEDTRQRVSGMIDDFADMVTSDGMPEAGMGPDSTMALYGVGLLPVMRVTLSDEALFEATVARFEAQAGEKMSVAEVDGHSYRYAGNDEARLVVAVIDEQLVVSAVPADLPEALLKSVLGISLPETSIAESGGLAALADKYGYQAYGLGMIDVARIAAIFIDDQEGVNGELLRLMDYDASELSDVCKTEILSVAGIAPRFVSGYTELTEEHIKSTSAIELRSDLAAGVRLLTAPVSGLGMEQGGLMSFGMSLNMLAAREFYSERLDALEADPYECEFFAGMQEAVAQGRAVLAQPVPPVVYGFRGLLAVIDDIKGMDIKNQKPPEEIDMRLLVATDSPEALLAMGAMFSPEIAAMNLQADSKPVKLEVPAVASQVDAAYVAMSDTALALSVGNGNETRLEAMLGADASDPSPFLSMSMDAGRYYGFIGDAMALQDEEADQSPEVVNATSDLMKTFEGMLSRVSFAVLFTENGIEMPSTMELAE